MATETRITVLGAGSTMGLPMARNLARAGLQVRAWNRTGEKARPLEEHGVRLLESPAQATKGADVMVTMLSDADAVIDAVQDALPSVHPGIVWLQMSTIGEVGIERCADLAAAHKMTLFDAPVLGTKQPAEDAKLVILASGPNGSEGARATGPDHIRARGLSRAAPRETRRSSRAPRRRSGRAAAAPAHSLS